jgi:hypothetical protein
VHNTFPAVAGELAGLSPGAVVARALETFAHDVAISFSGAEDVQLVEYAQQSGRPFRVRQRALHPRGAARPNTSATVAGGGGTPPTK